MPTDMELNSLKAHRRYDESLRKKPMTKKCTCGQPLIDPAETWPGREGKDICHLCWEAECSASWWTSVNSMRTPKLGIAIVRLRDCVSCVSLVREDSARSEGDPVGVIKLEVLCLTDIRKPADGVIVKVQMSEDMLAGLPSREIGSWLGVQVQSALNDLRKNHESEQLKSAGQTPPPHQ